MTLGAARQLTKSGLIVMAHQFQCHKNKMICACKGSALWSSKIRSLQVIYGTQVCPKTKTSIEREESY